MADPDVVDVHVHIAVDAARGPTSAGSVDDVLRKMDANGIGAAVAMPAPAYETPQGVASSAAQNDAIHAVTQKWPDRFPVALGVAEPRHGERGAREAQRALSGLGLGGLVFDNDVSGLAIDSDSMVTILERAADVPGRVVAVYTMAYSVLRSPFRLGVVARRFPAVSLVNLNAFLDITHESASYDLAERCENIWFDLGCAKTQLFTVEKAVERIGEHRLLFGSAIPDVEHSHHLEMVRIADVSADVRAKILAGNARRLFRIGDVAQEGETP